MKASCISCQEMIEVGNIPQLGDMVSCPKCDARLEVVWLDPVELDWHIDEYEYENFEEEEYDDEY